MITLAVILLIVILIAILIFAFGAIATMAPVLLVVFGLIGVDILFIRWLIKRGKR